MFTDDDALIPSITDSSNPSQAREAWPSELTCNGQATSDPLAKNFGRVCLVSLLQHTLDKASASTFATATIPLVPNHRTCPIASRLFIHSDPRLWHYVNAKKSLQNAGELDPVQQTDDLPFFCRVGIVCSLSISLFLFQSSSYIPETPSTFKYAPSKFGSLFRPLFLQGTQPILH